MRKHLRVFALCFIAWTVIGLFFFSQGLLQKLASGDPSPWWHYLATWLTGVWLVAALTPAILWLGHRFPIERRNWVRRVVLHLMLSALFSLVQIAGHSIMLPYLGVFPQLMSAFVPTLATLLVLGFHQNITSYWTILGLQYGWDYYQRYRERERQAFRLELDAAQLKGQLARAHLSALKMQLQPHFLFNTLNAIMVLVRQKRTREAEEMLARLSDLLRAVLEDTDAQEVPLWRELSYLRRYLAIEQVRFQDRLRVDYDVDGCVLDAAVPQMGLQPVVENAIRHGIGRSSASGRITIRASRAEGRLAVTVEDDGPGFDTSNGATSGHGIGLANTRERLEKLYGASGRLLLRNGEQGGAVVTMEIPYREIDDPAEAGMMEVHAADDAAGGR